MLMGVRERGQRGWEGLPVAAGACAFEAQRCLCVFTVSHAGWRVNPAASFRMMGRASKQLKAKGRASS